MYAKKAKSIKQMIFVREKYIYHLNSLHAESLARDSFVKSPFLTAQPNQSISKQQLIKQLRERIKRTHLCLGKPP